MKVRVTRGRFAGLSELKLVKTAAGYKPLSNGEEAAAPMPPLGRRLAGFSGDLRPAFNLLVLKMPPSGAQPLAAALDAEKFKEVAGTIAGDDTVLVITPSPRRAPRSRNAWRIYSDERPTTGRRSRSDGLCRLRAGPTSPRHPKLKSRLSICAILLCTRKPVLIEILPRLRGWGEAPWQDAFGLTPFAASGAGTAFLATPHEPLRSKSCRSSSDAWFARGWILSGAFRFHNPETFA